VPIFEDDCYADLIWGQTPAALYAMNKTGNVVHIGSFSKSIAPALRAATSYTLGCAVADAGAEDDAPGALEQMVLANIARPFCHACAETDARAARQARHNDGRLNEQFAPRPNSKIQKAASSCG